MDPILSAGIAVNKRKVIIDMDVVYPVEMSSKEMARILQDYIYICKFSLSKPQISVYPETVKVILNPIDIAQTLDEIKTKS